MQLFRAAACKYIHDLSGNGGLYAAGRWHRKGTRVIYFSEHISLAKLEVLANSVFLPKNMCLLTIEVSADIAIKKIDLDELPKNWESYPHPDSLKRITSAWIKESKTLLLKIPSVQSPTEYNYLLNPVHPEMKKVKLFSIEQLKFDQRLKISDD